MKDAAKSYELVSPIPVGWSNELWAWLTATGNFFGELVPSRDRLEAFLASMAGEQSAQVGWGVLKDGRPLAAMFYRPLVGDSLRVGGLNVVCPPAVWATESLLDAVGDVLGRLMWAGAVKIQLPMFVDDQTARVFWLKLGAEQEGVLRGQVLRGDVPADVRLLALWRPSYLDKAEQVGGVQSLKAAEERPAPVVPLVSDSFGELSEGRDRLLLTLTTERGAARFAFGLDVLMQLGRLVGDAIAVMKMPGQPDTSSTATH